MNQSYRAGQSFTPLIVVIAIVGVAAYLYLNQSPVPATENAAPGDGVTAEASVKASPEPFDANPVVVTQQKLVSPEQTVTAAKNPEPTSVSEGIRSEPASTNSPAEDDSVQTAVDTKAENGLPVPVRPWEAWEQPAFALLLSADQKGYFEPCGCTANQLGGMSRRFDLVSKMKSAGWDVRGLDTGGLSRRSGRQANLKMMTTLQALQQMNYLGVGLGAEELRLSVDGLLDVQMEMMNAENTVPFVSANVSILDGAVDGLPLKHRIVEVGGLKLGITSVMSPLVQKEVFPLADAAASDADQALKSVLAEFDQQKVDIRVLLSQATLEESLDYAKRFPQFQIVLTARGVGDPDPNAPPRKVGNTWVIEPGHQGKHAGVLAVYSGPQPKFRYQLVSLERDHFDDSPAMVKLMQQYQDRLKEEQVAKFDVVSAPHPSQSTYVGGQKCAECHDVSTEIWKNTPHSHAFDSLDPIHKRLGYERLNGVNRSWDPECLSCHVTGWDPQQYTRFASGFLNQEFAETPAEKRLHSLMLHSQCENCHGPGSQHVKLAEAGEGNSAESVIVTLANAEQQCKRCHDGDNSPEFDFESYWDRVKHYEE